MLLYKNISILRIIVFTICVYLLTMVTFFFAAVKDEGTSSMGIIGNFIADAFYVFRFPTHTLFEKTFLYGDLFLTGLLINGLCYGFLVERIFFLFNHYKSKQ